MVLLAMTSSAGATERFVCSSLKPGEAAKINTAEAAISAAKAAWLKGPIKLTPEYIAKYEPYTAVREREAWHVFGSLEGVGGTPEAAVCPSDGRTDTWHGQ